MKISKNHGIVTLPTVIIIGLLTLAVVVSITSISLNELFISQGASQSSSALFYAESGARDALVRIARNKNYVCNTTEDCYTIDFATSGCANGNGCAKIKVSSGVGSAADPKMIVSKGIMQSSTRIIQIRVELDNGTIDPSLKNGVITSSTWSEL